jgi:hypothetical protein
MTVTRRIRSPGRARNKPLKPLRAGMPGDLGATCGDYARVLHFTIRTRGCGCIGHPAFPTPSVGRKVLCTTRAISAAGLRSRIFRHCEERLVRRSSTSEGGSDEAIQSSFLRRHHGLLRFARNDGLGFWLFENGIGNRHRSLFHMVQALARRLRDGSALPLPLWERVGERGHGLSPGRKPLSRIASDDAT